MIPYTDCLKMLVWSLRRYSEWFRVRERLHCDVELRVGVQIAATMSQIWSLEEGGVWQRLLVALKAVAMTG